MTVQRMLPLLAVISSLAVFDAVPRAQSKTTHTSTPGYDEYVTGNPADVTRQTRGGLQLEGGGADIDEAFKWLIGHAGGGDIVILRASGEDGYNEYLMSLGPVDSVQSIVFKSRDASSAPAVLQSIERAEAVFLAGGDQANYIRYWKGTPVEAALNRLASRGVPIGGTSAGLAVLGEFSFAALNDTVTSPQALANPYDERVTLERGFLTMPNMKGIITDSHFMARDRLGRLLVFLSRIVKDGWAPASRAIAVDEKSAVLVEADGTARVVGSGPTFFLELSSGPARCEAGQPLTVDGIRNIRVDPGGTFDLRQWRAPKGKPSVLAVTAGTVTSSSGALY